MNNKQDMIQCGICGIPKYRHPYFENCGHDFLNEEFLKRQNERRNRE